MLHNSALPLPHPYLYAYRSGECTVVELHGEIDLAAILAIAACLDAHTSRAEPLIVIDLTHVTFLDCAGLGLLCRARRRAIAEHGELRLVCPHPQALRLLRLARLTATFRPMRTIAEATQGWRAAPPITNPSQQPPTDGRTDRLINSGDRDGRRRSYGPGASG
ncbi:STAS domain-containing protein [Streptomyces sp. SID1034]|uniref:STAS domain-containing protein n=1 Tax=Streptomyces TaxID=1883 RepID=UPI001371D1DF|nr:STAS domain-containing protein [Streptomyces sp. SID1034]MYV94957.1 anti-sigma factor antagonist [Streptomyces sp. SID1034]